MSVKYCEPNKTTSENSRALQTKFSNADVVIGVLMGMDAEGHALVVYPGSPSEVGLAARSIVALQEDDIGREVALLFENGEPTKPLIMGRIFSDNALAKPQSEPLVEMDGEQLLFSAKREIVLKCGKASITLTRAGKVLIRGSYLLSRSSGVNRIKGGSIQLN